MAAFFRAEKISQVLIRPESLFSKKNLFIPLLILVLALESLFIFDVFSATREESVKDGYYSTQNQLENGRSVFYEGGGLLPGPPGEAGTYSERTYVIGEAVRWESNELTLSDLSGGEFLRAQVGEETNFLVEDPSRSLTAFSTISADWEPIKELVKEGDVVAVFYTGEKEEKTNAVAADVLVLRRLGGLEQLRRETETKLTTPE